MGKTFDHIPEKYIKWIGEQEMFWVATAPLASDGHVNVSPKGLRGSFFVENPNRVWYDDLSGSGKVARLSLRENGRITIQFNAFQVPPDIVRLYEKGSIHELGSHEYEQRIPSSKRKPSSRAVIIIDISRVSTSCGWGVPHYKFEGHRKTLLTFGSQIEKNDNKFEPEASTNDPDAVAENGLKKFWRTYNAASIDGLRALKSAPFRKEKLESHVPNETEGAFRTKQVKVPDLNGLDEEEKAGRLGRAGMGRRSGEREVFIGGSNRLLSGDTLWGAAFLELYGILCQLTHFKSHSCIQHQSLGADKYVLYNVRIDPSIFPPLTPTGQDSLA